MLYYYFLVYFRIDWILEEMVAIKKAIEPEIKEQTIHGRPKKAADSAEA